MLAVLLGSVTTILSALVSVPLVLNAIGLAAFGVWAIGQLVITYASTVASGLGPTVQRYAAVASGKSDRRGLGSLFWTTSAVYAVIGLVVVATSVIAAPAIVKLFSIPSEYSEDATAMIRILGPAAAVSLYGSCLQSMLHGCGRFLRASTAAAATAVGYLALIALALTPENGLVFLALATLGTQLAGVAIRFAFLLDVVVAVRPGLIHRSQVRDFTTFTGQMQLTHLAGILTNQSDRLIIGLISSVAAVGEFAIGGQISTAVLLIGGTLLLPIVTELAESHGNDPGTHTLSRYKELQDRWTLLVVGTVLIICATVSPIIAAWLSRDTGDAALFAAITVLAYACNLLTGPATAYLRAIGQPALEARYGVTILVFNVLGSVVLGILLGAVGVVLGTFVAYCASAAVFFGGFGEYVQRGGRTVVYGIIRAGLAALIPALVAGFGCRLAVESVDGIVGLAACGIITGAALTSYLLVVGAVSGRKALAAITARLHTSEGM